MIIAKLLDPVAGVDTSIAESPRDADVLTPFGVEVRYASDPPEILAAGEVEAIGIARRVREAVVVSLQPYLDQE